MTLIRLAVAGMAAALALAAPAAAQEPEPDPLVNQSFYFKCQGPLKVQNQLARIKPVWAEQKPTASFTSGAGCGFLDPAILVGTSAEAAPADGVFGGLWDQRVETMNVEVHDLLLSQGQTALLGDYSFKVTLAIDGEEVISDELLEVVPTPSATGASQSFKFGISNLRLPKTDDPRQFVIAIRSHYSDSAAAWVFDASEVPAGVEFNPAKVARPTIKR
jgi:hypothetical protein